MELEGWWQENKRFALAVAGGAALFLVGTLAIDALAGSELTAQRRASNATAEKLRSEPLYGPAELEAARAENEALVRALDELVATVDFRPREAFSFDPRKGAASNQYFATVAGTREDLLARAGRAGLKLPEDLGLPALSPTGEAEIARWLAALDLVDRAVRLAIATGCERVDRIEIKLDPRLASRQGVGAVERTRVALSMSGPPWPLVRLLAATQSPELVPGGVPLTVESVEMAPRGKGRADEASLELVLVAARASRQQAGDGADEAEEAR
jgi:hypothetical protein